MNDQPETPDEHDDHDHPHFFVFQPPGMSEEQREAYRRQMDLQQAQMEAAAHRGVSFFESLNEEQLVAMRGLINAMAGNPESTLPYYMGVVSSHLQHRFGVCPACSKKHDEELEKLYREGKTEMSHGQADTDAEELVTQAYAWGVNFLGLKPGEQPTATTPVICSKGCGATFPNLPDRMLKPAGESGCPGCIHIAKNG